MIQARKIRLVNGRGKRRAATFGRPAPAKRRTRRNPGALIHLGILNPQKGRPMKKRSKKAPRKNPLFVHKSAKAHRGNRSRRRHRNPNFLSRPVSVLKTGAYALGGLVLTRQLPQMVLGAKNTGIFGYLANLAVAVAAGAAVGKAAGKEAGQAVGIGGSLYLANRIISENFSPIPKALALSGIGDAAAVGTMGAVVPGYFAHPVARDNSGKGIIPAAIVDAAKAAMPAPAATVKGLGRRGY